MIFRGLSLVILLTACFVFVPKAQAQQFNLEVNPEAGFDQIQEPFSNFLHSVTQIDISQGGSTSRMFFPQTEQAWAFWNQANQWVKDRTGLDILGVLKVVGNIIIFVMSIAIAVIETIIKVIQWLLSLIPGVSS